MSFLAVIKIFSSCWAILFLIKSSIIVDVSIELRDFLIFAIKIENCVEQAIRISDWRFFLNAINDDDARKSAAISNCDFNNEFNLNARFDDVF